jgi:hypothetical protein
VRNPHVENQIDEVRELYYDGLYVRAYFPAKDHKRLFLEEVEITSPRFKIKHGLDVGTASLLRSSGSSILIEALG